MASAATDTNTNTDTDNSIKIGDLSIEEFKQGSKNLYINIAHGSSLGDDYIQLGENERVFMICNDGEFHYYSCFNDWDYVMKAIEETTEQDEFYEKFIDDAIRR